jgi:DNA-binding response OmpR family regulator
MFRLVYSVRMPPDPSHSPTDDGAADAAPGTGNDGTVLVVDDEEPFARTVALWLDEYWTTMVATDGEEAVRRYGPTVDAVLLDRRMPRLSGDEALDEIRAQDGSARVAMMTALEPDLDVVDLEFDMYLEKPVDRQEVVDTTRTLLERANYSRELQALYALSSKIAELQARYPEEMLTKDDRFKRLLDEHRRVRQKAESQLGDVDEAEFVELLQIVDDGGT